MHKLHRILLLEKRYLLLSIIEKLSMLCPKILFDTKILKDNYERHCGYQCFLAKCFCIERFGYNPNHYSLLPLCLRFLFDVHVLVYLLNAIKRTCYAWNTLNFYYKFVAWVIRLVKKRVVSFSENLWPVKLCLLNR